MKSKGRIKELTYGSAFKLSKNFQSADCSFSMTKEFDDDGTVNWEEEKAILKQEVEDFLSEQFGETLTTLTDIGKQVGR